MLICAAGDIHGRIDRLYAAVAEFERSLGQPFALVLHVGDFGIWPDPARVDKATRKHDGAGDFPAWHADCRPVPCPTIFIKGNHEDFGFLDALGGAEPLPGLRYLPNGAVIEQDGLRIAGVGGCYSERDSDNSPSRNRQGSPTHYTLGETQRLLAPGSGHIDILLSHDAPGGIEVGEYVAKGESLRALIERKQPSIAFFGHHHVRVRAEIAGVPLVGLAFVDRPGWLVAWDSERGPIAEWPT
jgi:predicted phosphodiesterase